MRRNREEQYIYDKIKKEIPTIKQVGRNYILREYDSDKLADFFYEVFKRGVTQGEKNAKISFKGRIKKAVARVLE